MELQRRQRPRSSRKATTGRTSQESDAPADRSAAEQQRRGDCRLEPEHGQLVMSACSSPTTMLVRETRSSVIWPDEPPGPVQSTTQYDVAVMG
jgi:hypothetical protein